jgi:Domain of unknown function (DUF5060)
MKLSHLIYNAFIWFSLTVSYVLPQVISGELRKWHKVTLTFTGPLVSETNPDNPFLNYRFDVIFLHKRTGKQYKVPGYFAADGVAANTSATAGNKWNCHFAPDDVGMWIYTASFVYGTNVSVSLTGGSPISFHGTTGSFNVIGTDKLGRDHRKKGRLRYVGRNYLQYADAGEWFLKVGSDRYDSFLVFFFLSTPLTLFLFTLVQKTFWRIETLTTHPITKAFEKLGISTKFTSSMVLIPLGRTEKELVLSVQSTIFLIRV